MIGPSSWRSMALALRRVRGRSHRHVVAGGVLLFAASLACAFDLQGHRGARGLAPENSLPAFEVAIALGVTTLELDVAITRDGVIVIHHDLALNPDIARGADGRWLDRPGAPIHMLAWSELQTYDIGRLRPGSRYASQYPQQQAIDGTRIPRLVDLFEMVERGGHDRLRFAIETKIDPTRPDATLQPEPYAVALVDAIRAAGLQKRTQIISFDWRTLQVVQRIAPEIDTVYITAQQRWLDTIGAGMSSASPWTAGIAHRDHGSVPKMIQAAGGSRWSAHWADLDAEKVRQAHALGIKVLAWTVNEAAAIARVLDLGVDGLVTDRPDVAVPLLRERRIQWR